MAVACKSQSAVASVMLNARRIINRPHTLILHENVELVVEFQALSNRISTVVTSKVSWEGALTEK